MKRVPSAMKKEILGKMYARCFSFFPNINYNNNALGSDFLNTPCVFSFYCKILKQLLIKLCAYFHIVMKNLCSRKKNTLHIITCRL